MQTTTFFGEIVGDREHTPASKCTCALNGRCLEHSYPLDDPGMIMYFGKRVRPKNCDDPYRIVYSDPYCDTYIFGY